MRLRHASWQAQPAAIAWLPKRSLGLGLGFGMGAAVALASSFSQSHSALQHRAGIAASTDSYQPAHLETIEQSDRQADSWLMIHNRSATEILRPSLRLQGSPGTATLGQPMPTVSSSTWIGLRLGDGMRLPEGIHFGELDANHADFETIAVHHFAGRGRSLGIASEPARGMVIPFVAYDAAGMTSLLSLANVEDAPAVVTATLVAAEGPPIHRASISLTGGEALHGWLGADILPNLPAGSVGALLIESSSAVTAASQLVQGDWAAVASIRARALDDSAPEAFLPRFHRAYFDHGNATYNSALALFNPNDRAIDIRIEWTSDGGYCRDPELAPTLDSLAAGGFMLYRPGEGFSDQVGEALAVNCTGTLAVHASGDMIALALSEGTQDARAVALSAYEPVSPAFQGKDLLLTRFGTDMLPGIGLVSQISVVNTSEKAGRVELRATPLVDAVPVWSPQSEVVLQPGESHTWDASKLHRYPRGDVGLASIRSEMEVAATVLEISTLRSWDDIVWPGFVMKPEGLDGGTTRHFPQLFQSMLLAAPPARESSGERLSYTGRSLLLPMVAR